MRERLVEQASRRSDERAEPTDTILAKSMRRGTLMAARREERGAPVAER